MVAAVTTIYHENFQKLNELFVSTIGKTIEQFMLTPYEDSLIRLKSNGYMDLTIEKYSSESIIIGHYSEQNGDLMSDPQMEIRVRSEKLLPGTCEALTFRNDYAGLFQEVYPDETHVRPILKKELNGFLKMWLNNLKSQGFYKSPVFK